MTIEEILQQVKDKNIDLQEAERLILSLKSKPESPGASTPKADHETKTEKSLIDKLVNKDELKKTVDAFMQEYLSKDGLKASIGKLTESFFEGTKANLKVSEGSMPTGDLKQVFVSSPIGEIEVSRSSDDQIHYEVWANDVESWQITPRAKDNAFHLEAESSLSSRKHMRMGESLFIALSLPQNLKLTVEGKSVSVDASGLIGDIEIESLSGDVDLENCEGALSVELASGDIAVENHAGDLYLNTKSGDVSIAASKVQGKVKTLSGDLELESSSGNIAFYSLSGDCEVEGFQGKLFVESKSGDLSTNNVYGDFECKLMSGDIEVENEKPVSEGTYVLYTTSGDVSVNIPATSSVAVKLQTVSGDHSIEVPEERTLPHNNREITLGDGKCDVLLRSVSGNVSLELE
ncbi:MAG: DUF4097 domain-containing protein [Oligoflexales bacterium]